ncbi:cell envelope integrity protein TolA [Teredinibacter turnerae]|uniref:cell envelope integrity protein TolA n=1 Tax=Teredinibacter turnerae TaxID=2426 RepID=UPI0003822293|nr:cell envelope integrity protein TolA [Teredinibacter turnerae]
MLARSYAFPIAVSVILHGLVVAVLFVNFGSTPPPRKVVAPQYIEAKLVELEKKAKPASAPKKPKVVDLTAQRKAQEIQKRAAEKQRQLKIQADKEAEAKRRAEKKQREKDEREKLAQQQREIEQQKRERMQQEFAEALKEEQGLLAADESATVAQSYADVIQRRIEQQWSRPPSARNGMRCELTIDMVPNGRIIDVNLKKSSGNSAFDRSAIAAVKKVEVIPEVKDIPIDVFERHFRKFSLAFQPEDLRQ